MSSTIRPAQLLVVVALSAAALGGALGGVAGRGADDAFLLDQRNPTRISASAVERLMLTAPDPAPPHKATAARARCRAGGRRRLRNPWHCSVRYRSGTVVRYVTSIRTDGSYRARYALAIYPDGRRQAGGTATATGCCLNVPAAE